MRKSLILALMIAPLLGSGPYYISKSTGNDTYDGLEKAHTTGSTGAWEHLPGMVTCASNCASHTPAAGEQFILMGGDTWTASDLGVAWNWSGTAGSPIYVGVDKTWYSGGSWTRPIWTCGGTVCGGASLQAHYIWNTGSNYVTVDNIEATGLHTAASSGGGYFYGYGLSQIYENNYIHGWSHAASGDTDTACAFCEGGAPTTGTCIHDNVIDGSDTTQDMINGMTSSVPCAYNNVIRYVTNGIEGGGSNWHDNQVGPIVVSFTAGMHQNAIFNYGPDNSATTMFIYNNVITGKATGGMVTLWLSGLGTNTATGYAFNNVLYNNASGNMVDLAPSDAASPGTYGTWYFFNNTVECGTDVSTGLCASDVPGGSGTFVFHSENNHWISGTSPAVSCNFSTCTTTTDLLHSVATANGQGYTSGSTYAFQPTLAVGSTVGAGTNVQALCTTIAVLNATAGSACQSDTTYAVGYNTSNHTVIFPARPVVSWPFSLPWDVGAYQFSGVPTAPALNLLARKGP